MSLNKDLLLLGKGQNRGECVSQSRRQGLCAGACNSALVTAAKGGAGPGGGGSGAAVGISLVFGKRERCPEVFGGGREEGGHHQRPCWDGPGLGWGLHRSPMGRECSLLPADTFLRCGVNHTEMHQNRSGGVTSLQHSSPFCLFIFAFNLKLLSCRYTKYVIYMTYIKAVR